MDKIAEPGPEPRAVQRQIEQEWKLNPLTSWSDGEWQKSLNKRGFSVSSGEAIEQSDIYFDSPDLHLFRSGRGLRRRTLKHHQSWTFKGPSAGVVDGEHRRLEIEIPADGSEMPTGINDLPDVLRDQTAPWVLDRPLVQVLTLETHRRNYQILDSSGVVSAELSVDKVDAGHPDGRQFSFQEIELESRVEEFPGALCVADFHSAGWVEFLSQNKVERAFAAFDLSRRDQSPTLLTRAIPLRHAVAHILRKQIEKSRVHEVEVRTCDEPEGVHQMRVRLRRLRSALKLFRAVIQTKQLRNGQSVFRSTSRHLGAVRDLDVFFESTRETVESLHFGTEGDWQRLREPFTAQRQRAKIRLLRWLHSKARLTAQRRFEEALEKWSRDDSPDFKLGDVAPGLIFGLYRRARKIGNRLEMESPAEEFHELRIRLKQLRYALDAFADVYGERFTSLAERIAEIQEILGRANDAFAHARLVLKRAASIRPRGGETVLLALGALAGAMAAQEKAARAEFFPAWNRISGTKTRDLLRRALGR